MTIIIAVLLSVLIVAADQVIKYFIEANMTVGQRITVIDGMFYLDYTQNRGAAFGMFQDATLIFAAITVVLIAVFFYLLVTKKFTGKLFTASVILVSGGGIGNLIDRLIRHYVVDYLSLSFFPPVCNFADYCITIGAVLFIISVFIVSDNRKKLESKKPAVEAATAEEEKDRPEQISGDSENE